MMDMRRLARWLDTNGTVSLHKGSSNYILRVEITGISKRTAEEIRDFCGSGYVLPQGKVGRVYKFTISASQAINILTKLIDYSAWQKRQIKTAQRYQQLMLYKQMSGDISGTDESITAKMLVSRIKLFNEQLQDKQRLYHQNRR